MRPALLAALLVASIITSSSSFKRPIRPHVAPLSISWSVAPVTTNPSPTYGDTQGGELLLTDVSVAAGANRLIGDGKPCTRVS